MWKTWVNQNVKWHQKIINWPDGNFEGSVSLFKDYILETEGESFEGWEDYEVEDEMPSTNNFKFLVDPNNEGFYEGWEEHFKETSPEKYIPFASDDNYFYFLTQNPENENDPSIHSVDHEETSEEPYEENGLTLNSLLAMLTLKKED